MQNIIFLVFRRMRRPLLILLLTYSITILGLVLIPGRDAAGNVWHMDFFHAFYFISFTATTIGFGEVPYEFTDGQRLWVIISIYSTVVVWIYAIGNLLRLVQDRAFQQAMTERRFARLIRRLPDRSRSTRSGDRHQSRSGEYAQAGESTPVCPRLVW
jgi:hypothetical protein